MSFILSFTHVLITLSLFKTIFLTCVYLNSSCIFHHVVEVNHLFHGLEHVNVFEGHCPISLAYALAENCERLPRAVRLRGGGGAAQGQHRRYRGAAAGDQGHGGHRGGGGGLQGERLLHRPRPHQVPRQPPPRHSLPQPRE